MEFCSEKGCFKDERKHAVRIQNEKSWAKCKKKNKKQKGGVLQDGPAAVVVVGFGAGFDFPPPCPFTYTSGPGMTYDVGFLKMLSVIPGSAWLYQVIGDEPPFKGSVPEPVTTMFKH